MEDEWEMDDDGWGEDFEYGEEFKDSEIQKPTKPTSNFPTTPDGHF